MWRSRGFSDASRMPMSDRMNVAMESAVPTLMG